MFSHQAKADLSTKISLRPVGSQVLLVAIVIVSGMCFLTGFFFLWYDRSGWPIPVLTGAILALLALFAWFTSKRDVDFSHASPTQIITPTGLEVTADARSLASPDLLQGLTRVLQIVNHREPLPDPDGLVNNEGVPVEGSKADAVSRVCAINQLIRKQTGEFTTMFSSDDQADVVRQPLLSREGDSSLAESNIAASTEPTEDQ